MLYKAMAEIPKLMFLRMLQKTHRSIARRPTWPLLLDLLGVAILDVVAFWPLDLWHFAISSANSHKTGLTLWNSNGHLASRINYV